MANSMTSIGCLVFGTGLMVMTSFRFIAYKRYLVHMMAIAVISAACVPLFMEAAGGVLNAVGRDPTLTQRTELWGDVFVLNPNALLGAGFESFWMGPRLAKLWVKYQWRPNESHNGYLEVYLNLGFVGIALLATVVGRGYSRAVTMLRVDPELGRFKVACVVVGLVYSLTEAAFRLMHPMWMSTLMAAFLVPIAEPEAAAQPAASVAAPTQPAHAKRLQPAHTFTWRRAALTPRTIPSADTAFD
jgi:O-antigen ligase